MRLRRAPSCLDEPSVGADGREIGKQGELQRRLDQISADNRAATGARPQPPRVAPRDAASELWAEAEAICERNGLSSNPGALPRPTVAEVAVSRVSGPAGSGEPPVALLRSCPRCRHDMKPAATLCGFCWLRVAPMGLDGVEPPALPPRRAWWR